MTCATSSEERYKSKATYMHEVGRKAAGAHPWKPKSYMETLCSTRTLLAAEASQAILCDSCTVSAQVMSCGAKQKRKPKLMCAMDKETTRPTKYPKRSQTIVYVPDAHALNMLASHLAQVKDDWKDHLLKMHE